MPTTKQTRARKSPEKPAASRRCAEAPGSAWALASEKLPEVGDIIACQAEHEDGGPMYWAGRVVDIRMGRFAVMETRGICTRQFIITHDTLWVCLPNTEVRHARAED